MFFSSTKKTHLPNETTPIRINDEHANFTVTNTVIDVSPHLPPDEVAKKLLNACNLTGCKTGFMHINFKAPRHPGCFTDANLRAIADSINRIGRPQNFPGGYFIACHAYFQKDFRGIKLSFGVGSRQEYKYE